MPLTTTTTTLARISYHDLLDLFGDATVTTTDTTSNNSNSNIKNEEGKYDEKEECDQDRQSIDRLIGILEQSPYKIVPLLHTIKEAFGTSTAVSSATTQAALGLGFLEVTRIPPEMVDLRKRLLPKASELANLSSNELFSLEKPETGYSIGWSHGKESFRVDDDKHNESNSGIKDGVPKRRYDTAKGSFYMNPFADASTTNVYPPSLQPSLEDDLLQMTRFMSEVGLWIAVLCDLYLDSTTTTATIINSPEQECPSHNRAENTEIDFIPSSISTNQWMVYKSLKYGKPAAKARLLYYFPQTQQQEQKEEKKKSQEISFQTNDDDVYDDWCGWHTDHGTLTGLLPGMLCDDQEQTNDFATKQLLPLKSSLAGPKPGLYIKTKLPVAVGGNTVGEQQQQQQEKPSFKERLTHVDLAPDSLGFQLGETLEILSGGKFEATVHGVKAPPSSAASSLLPSSSSSVGRASLAVFLQPLASQVLPPLASAGEDSDRDSSAGDGKSNYEDDGDEFSLRKRWRSTFGEFQRVTIESFS